MIGNVVVDVLLLLLLKQLREVGLVLVEHPVSLCTYPLQICVWLSTIGVKVLVKPVVLEKRSPVPLVGRVLTKYDAVVLVIRQQLVYVVEMTQLRVLSDFYTTQNPLDVLVRESFINKSQNVHL